MRPSTWIVTILLVAAMFTGLACSASESGDLSSPVGDSASGTADPTFTDEAALPKEVKSAEEQANEVSEPRKPATGPQAAEVEGIAAWINSDSNDPRVGSTAKATISPGAASSRSSTVDV